MLTRLISTVFTGMLEVMLWLILIGAVVGGGEVMDGFKGAVVGLVVGFIFELSFFGVILLMIDIMKSVRNIEKSKACGVQTEN